MGGSVKSAGSKKRAAKTNGTEKPQGGAAKSAAAAAPARAAKAAAQSAAAAAAAASPAAAEAVVAAATDGATKKALQRAAKAAAKNAEDAQPALRTSVITKPSSLVQCKSLYTTNSSFTPPVLSKFERAMILGHRTRELSLGAPTLAPLGAEWRPLEIAERELELGLLDDYALQRSMHGITLDKGAEQWILSDFALL